MVRRVKQSREAIEVEEDLVIDAHLLIQQLLNETGMTRADLARAMGVSQARLSQVMAVDANPTLRTLSQIFFAMGRRLVLSERRVADGRLPLAEAKIAAEWREHDVEEAPEQKARKIPMFSRRPLLNRAGSQSWNYNDNDVCRFDDDRPIMFVEKDGRAA